MDTVATELVIVARVGLVMLVKLRLAPIIATIMGNVLKENATAELDSLVMIVQFELALPIAMVTVVALILPVLVLRVGLGLIARYGHAPLSALAMDIAIMELVSANLVLLVFTVPCLHVRHLVLEMVNVSLLDHR